MLIMFSARRLKPGAWDQFRRAWEGAQEARPPGLRAAYHARNIRDEDEIISFGMFDMTEEDYRRWQVDAGDADRHRISELSAFIENDHVSGVFEVVETLEE